MTLNSRTDFVEEALSFRCFSVKWCCDMRYPLALFSFFRALVRSLVPSSPGCGSRMSDEFTTITEQPCACGAHCDKKFWKKKLQILLNFLLKRRLMDLQINVCVAHCGKIPIFVQKYQSFLAGKFKFNVGVDFTKIEFLDKNWNFASVCRARHHL